MLKYAAREECQCKIILAVKWTHVEERRHLDTDLGGAVQGEGSHRVRTNRTKDTTIVLEQR